jgi:hypothetical protein
MPEINYEVIVSQLKEELDTNCAISNKYGIVLSSNINEFAEGSVIPHKILELISSKTSIAEELRLNEISSFALETQEYNYLFTFSENLILISKVDLSINLAKFMPSLRIFIEKLSKSYREQEDGLIQQFSLFDFSKEIEKIEASMEMESINKEKYSIIKELVNYISK